MVATVIARLAEAGRLSLDDPVAAHVPELRAGGWAERATLRDLLANRSGLPLRAGLEFDFAAEGTRTTVPSRGSRRMSPRACLRPAFWSYTNVGWCLLGRVIETATGAAWEDAMRRHLAGMGMRETTFATGAGRSGAHPGTRSRPRARCRSSRWSRARMGRPARLPSRRSRISFGSPPCTSRTRHLPRLRAVHAEVSIYGWLDSWCLGWARFDWEGGPVWGWDGLINGRAVGSADHAGASRPPSS